MIESGGCVARTRGESARHPQSLVLIFIPDTVLRSIPTDRHQPPQQSVPVPGSCTCSCPCPCPCSCIYLSLCTSAHVRPSGNIRAPSVQSELHSKVYTHFTYTATGFLCRADGPAAGRQGSGVVTQRGAARWTSPPTRRDARQSARSDSSHRAAAAPGPRHLAISITPTSQHPG